MVAPAAMLDGQIQAIRKTLDAHGFHNLPIMAYSQSSPQAYMTRSSKREHNR